VKRRTFVFTGLAAITAPGSVLAASSGRACRIGVLVPSAQQWESAAFSEALRRLGYVQDQNLTLDIRSANGTLDRLPALATALVAARPDVIVAVNTPGAKAAIEATKTIPIVMVVVGDPVGSGFAESLAHPGGNATCLSNLSGELAAKRLSVLKEVVPVARRVAILLNPNDPITVPQLKDTRDAAAAIGIEVRPFPVTDTAQLPAVFDQVSQWRADGGLWLAGQAATLEKGTIELALKHRLPVMYALKRDVHDGGLVSYFAEYVELFSHAALYVDKILNGAKPADLPIEQPTKFELAINLGTAKALGLTVPQFLLAQADEVIE
jgi:putative ABC transport system substrate-binding protein